MKQKCSQNQQSKWAMRSNTHQTFPVKILQFNIKQSKKKEENNNLWFYVPRIDPMPPKMDPTPIAVFRICVGNNSAVQR